MYDYVIRSHSAHIISPPSYARCTAKQHINFHPPTFPFVDQNTAPEFGWHSLASQSLVRSEVALAVPRVRGLQLPASSLSPFHALAAWNVVDHVILILATSTHLHETRPSTGHVSRYRT
jgi:hypothetical protein